MRSESPFPVGLYPASVVLQVASIVLSADICSVWIFKTRSGIVCEDLFLYIIYVLY